MQRVTGRYISTSYLEETVEAFVPLALPPVPPLQFASIDLELLERAAGALGRLDALASDSRFPETELFLYFYIRKEALLSSQIEGTQSSLAEILAYENESNPPAPREDLAEVINYINAIQYGIRRLAELPLSLRLIREVHGELMRGLKRGGEMDPGNFRRTQNWIGGTRPGTAVYVPPPPQELMRVLGELEDFLQGIPEATSPLIKAALAHVQFETIHPFLDGNGRVGRLLITLIMISEATLKHPILYLSLYFKTHRDEYYQLLQSVRVQGNWEDWLRFFLRAVEQVSLQGLHTAQRLQDQALADAELVRSKIEGRQFVSVLGALRQLQRHPITSIPELARGSGLSGPTAARALTQLARLGIVIESTGGKRDRRYHYLAYLDILGEGTEAYPSPH